MAAFSAFLVIYIGTAHADSQGPLSASSTSDCIDDNTGTIGTVAWTNPGNAFSNNTTYATVSVDGTTSHYIKCTNFGFSIPTGSTINGIVVGVDRKSSSTSNGGSQDAAVRIVKGGTVGTTDKSTATIYTTSDTYEDHGTGTTDLWGLTWTVSDINASNFGAAFAAKKASAAGAAHTVSVDHIRITVYYTPPVTAYNQATYRVFSNQDASSVVTFSQAWGVSALHGQGNQIIKTSDGGYAVAGYMNGVSSNTADILLVKYDGVGHTQWSTEWSTTGDDFATGLVQTTDGGYAITGYSNLSSGTIIQSVLLIKYTSTGSLSWSKSWSSGTGSSQANALVQTSDGGYAVTGSIFSGIGHNKVFLSKYDATGTLSWTKNWGGGSFETGYSIIQTSDGGYAITGATSSFGAGNNDVFLAKFDSSGTVSWNKVWGGTADDYGFSLKQTTDGGYVVAGTTSSFGAGGSDVFVAKFDSSGTVSWNKVWGTSANEDGNSIIQTSDGGYAVAADMQSSVGGTMDAVVLKYDSSGTLSWNKAFGGSSDEVYKSVVQLSSGGYVATGYTSSSGVGLADVLLSAYDSSGAISGCSTQCSTPSASSSSPSATTSSPSATNSTVSPATSTPSPSTLVPSPTTTSIVAVSPTIDVGSALATLNTAATVPADGQPFRLRMDIGISSANLAANTSSLKLQYASRSGTCDTSFSGETYSDVTDTTTIRYYDNANAVNGLPLATNANDPTDGGNTLVRQTYQEKGTSTFTNPTAINTGQDGMWDFALTTSHTLAGTHYCLRIIKSTGTNLDTYTNIAEIITPSTSYTQSSYRVFNAGQSVKTFAEGLAGDLINDSDEADGIVQTSDGGYAITGTRDLQTETCMPVCIFNDTLTAFIAKYDSSGTLSWEKEWGNGNETGSSIVQTSDGGYAIAGSASSFGAGLNDAFIVKFDSSGNVTWNKLWGGTGDDGATSIVQTSDGGYAITGGTAFGAGNTDAYLAKFTSTGVLSWNKTWGSTAQDVGESLVQTSDGGYAVAGDTLGFGDGGYDLFLLKFDSSGNLSWNKVWGGTGDDNATSLIQTSDGGYAVAGDSTGFGGAGYEALLIKYDSSGNVSWNKSWDGAGDDRAYSVAQTSDGGYVIGGSTGSFNGGVLIAKYDSSGNLSWSRTRGDLSTHSSTARAIIQTSDGGYAIAGTGDSIYGSIMKFDTEGGMNNCSSLCSIPWAVTQGSPGAVTSSPSATSGAPTATITTPSATLASTMTNSALVALGSSASAGAPLVAQNKPYDALKVSNQFRLRVDVGVSNSGVDVSGQSFKLQYSVRGSDLSCDASFTGESYADVTTTTPVYFYDGTGASGDGVSGNYTNDPSDGTNVISPQTYVEANNFTNAMMALYAGQSGEWDFSLAVKSGTMPSNDYCLRIVKSDGTLLDSYSQIVDIAYGPSMPALMRQEAWFNRSGIRQNFFIKGQ